jgi:hypothetical protein
MMATPHMVVGAALGRVLRRPWLAYPVAFASHFALDTLPHLDSHALFGVEHGGPTPWETASGVTDSLVGAVLVSLLARRQPGRRVMMGSALCAILIDLAEYVPPFGPWFQTWAGTAWLVGFHHRIQHNLTPAQWPLGAATQALALGLALAVCLRGGRSRPEATETQPASA